MPVNVLARNGRRDCAHSGPCSVILGVVPKWRASKSDGGGGDRRAQQKECAVSRREALRTDDMVLTGRGGLPMDVVVVVVEGGGVVGSGRWTGR